MLIPLLLLVCIGLWDCSTPAPQEGDACTDVDDCAGESPLACSQRQCVRIACARTAQCPAGAACVRGVCTVPECEVHDDCPSDQLCFEGDCRSDLCEFKAECDPGEVCIGVPPRCARPPARCDDDRECPTDRFCKLPEGTCEPRCTSDAGCPPGSYCDDEFCRLSCVTSSDCAFEAICVDGRCVTNDCELATCPDDRPFIEPQVCECVECLAELDCRTDRNERCDDSGTCRYCPVRAASEGACIQQGLRLVHGCCSECERDAHCPEGTRCDSGRCELADPRDCLRDDDCPVDSHCDLGTCVMSGSGAPCSGQTDCATGEACHPGGVCRPESDACADGCEPPNRCVAEPGDDVGSCRGCTERCSEEGCPEGTACHVPAGASEGWCAARETMSDCS